MPEVHVSWPCVWGHLVPIVNGMRQLAASVSLSELLRLGCLSCLSRVSTPRARPCVTCQRRRQKQKQKQKQTTQTTHTNHTNKPHKQTHKQTTQTNHTNKHTVHGHAADEAESLQDHGWKMLARQARGTFSHLAAGHARVRPYTRAELTIWTRPGDDSNDWWA